MKKGKKIYEGKAKILYKGPKKIQLFSSLKTMLPRLTIKKNLQLAKRGF